MNEFKLIKPIKVQIGREITEVDINQSNDVYDREEGILVIHIGSLLNTPPHQRI